MRKFVGFLLSGLLVLGSLAGCASAEFEVSPVTITPSEVVAGEPFNVMVEVTNVGGAEGTYSCTLTLDGTVIDTKAVKVAAGASETISFTCNTDNPGTRNLELNGSTATITVLRPAEFKVVSISVPTEMTVGEPVSVTADITNLGEVKGTYMANLKVEDIGVITQEVVLSPGDTKTVSFPLSEVTPGKCTLQLGELTDITNILELSEIVEHAILVFDKVNSWQCDLTLNTLIKASRYSPPDGEMIMEIRYALDIQEKQMMMINEITEATVGEARERTMIEIYLLGDEVYLNVEAPEESTGWIRSELPSALWNALELEMKSQTQSQLISLRDAEIRPLQSEIIDGIDCYVFDVIPSKESLSTMILSQYLGGGEPVNFETLEQVVESIDVTARHWISKNTHFFIKSTMTTEMDFTEVEGEGYYMVMDIVCNVWDHNETLNIVLPPEAEEAQDVTQQQGEVAETELANVQAAVWAMMVDNEVPYLPNPIDYAGGTATNDMTAFPDSTTTAADKGYTGVGTPKAGYVLHAHDLIGADTTTFDTVNYVATTQTTYYYTCEADGTVRQFDGPDVATATEYKYK